MDQVRRICSSLNLSPEGQKAMDVSKMTSCERIASVAKSGHVFARMVDTLHTRAGNKSLSGEDLSTPDNGLERGQGRIRGAP